jgi:hypothetical protein
MSRSGGPAKAASETGFTFARDLPIPAGMRPEISRAIDDIQQAITLLRRHL